jgi:hypothetical protein
MAAIARDLDISMSETLSWVKPAPMDNTPGQDEITTKEQGALTRLRRDKDVLKMAREIQKKKRRSSSPRTVDTICIYLCRGGALTGEPTRPVTGGFTAGLTTGATPGTSGRAAAESERQHGLRSLD